MRVFLDANVLFSASNGGSNIARLIERTRQSHTVVTSDFALEEAQRNIAAKRPDWRRGLGALESHLEIVPSVVIELPVELDDKDRPILATAIRSACNLLVTGDRRHFGHLYGREVAGVTIVSVLELAVRVFRNPS